MPRRNKPTAIYRELLKNAWSLTWQRKRLWVFGALASIVASGGVADMAWRSLRRVERGKDLLSSVLDGSVPGLEPFGIYVQRMLALGPTRATVTLSLLTILAVILIVAAVGAQAGLVQGLASRKPLSLRAALEKGKPSFWPLLGLNAISKLAGLAIVTLSTLPLALFVMDATLVNAALYFLVFLVLFPATLAVAVISMFATVHLVRRGSGIGEAIREGARLLREHWLISLELAVILFMALVAAVFGLIAALVLLAIPFAIIIAFTLSAGSLVLFLLAYLLASIAVTVVAATFIGAAVSFQHAAWLHLYEKASHPSRTRRLMPKLERILHRWQ